MRGGALIGVLRQIPMASTGCCYRLVLPFKIELAPGRAHIYP
jgi:hypothetical protein